MTTITRRTIGAFAATVLAGAAVVAAIGNREPAPPIPRATRPAVAQTRDSVMHERPVSATEAPAVSRRVLLGVRRALALGYVDVRRGADPAAPAPMSQAAGTQPQEITALTGGVFSAPSFLPTAPPDWSTFSAHGVTDEVFSGTLVGVSIVEGTLTFDPATTDVHGHLVETFTGIYTHDYSSGTLVLDEEVTGNLLRNEALVDATIVSGDGDPTFQCSGGHVVFPYHLNAVFAFGGYTGTWRHGCPAPAR